MGDEQARQPRQFGGLGVPAVPDDFDAPLPEDELDAWEGTSQAQADALATLAAAEHLDDLEAVIAARKAGEARARHDLDLDSILVEARAATDSGRRTGLDDAIRELGYTRAELEAENPADELDDPVPPEDAR